MCNHITAVPVKQINREVLCDLCVNTVYTLQERSLYAGVWYRLIRRTLGQYRTPNPNHKYTLMRSSVIPIVGSHIGIGIPLVFLFMSFYKITP